MPEQVPDDVDVTFAPVDQNLCDSLSEPVGMNPVDARRLFKLSGHLLQHVCCRLIDHAAAFAALEQVPLADHGVDAA
ncbi:hypothetical protein D3C80_2147070 [compost metagenome]